MYNGENSQGNGVIWLYTTKDKIIPKGEFMHDYTPTR